MVEVTTTELIGMGCIIFAVGIAIGAVIETLYGASRVLARIQPDD